MSQAELKSVEVLALRRARAITQAEAGRQLGVSGHQVRRLELRFGKEGEKGLEQGRLIGNWEQITTREMD